MKCTTKFNADPAPGAFVPIKKLKIRDAPSASGLPANPPAPPGVSGGPSIRANPANVTGGSTTLTWDGGSEHPYAEVWVGIDGGDPIFVVEQGKGSRRVTVDAGKTYRYVLTDSGQDLATVTVRGQ